MVSCTCTRVNVLEGHTEAVFVSTEIPFQPEDIARVIQNFNPLKGQELTSAPEHMILVHSDPCHPQPRLDRNSGNGMATTVGRIREDNALENGIKYVPVSHNTRMMAARGSVLTAEQLIREGYIQEK